MGILEEVRELLRQQTSVQAALAILDDTYSLSESRVLDSLAIVIFVDAIEKHFAINIEAEELNHDNFKNLQSIASLLERKLMRSSQLSL